MPSLSQIHHLALKVTDLEGVASFYRDVLQIKESKRQLDEKGAERAVWFECSGVILMIEKIDTIKREPAHQAGWHLLAFTIKPEERDIWENHLQNRGVKIISRSDYSLYFEDPEGNRVALSHFPEQATI